MRSTCSTSSRRRRPASISIGCSGSAATSSSNPGLCRDLNQRALEQAVKALTLVLQAGNFGLVAFDVAEAPPDAVRRLPFTTWLRLQRMIEGSQTTCVLVGGGAAGAQLGGADGASWAGRRGHSGFEGRLFRRAQRPSARSFRHGRMRSPAPMSRVPLSTTCAWCPHPHALQNFAVLAHERRRTPRSEGCLGPIVMLRLVDLAQEFSPRYERHRDDLVSIDVSGLGRLFGDAARDRRGAAARGGRARRARARRDRRHAHGGDGPRAGAARGSRWSSGVKKPRWRRDSDRRRAGRPTRYSEGEHEIWDPRK